MHRISTKIGRQEEKQKDRETDRQSERQVRGKEKGRIRTEVGKMNKGKESEEKRAKNEK